MMGQELRQRGRSSKLKNSLHIGVADMAVANSMQVFWLN